MFSIFGRETLFVFIQRAKKHIRLTGVWQNGGRSAKLNFCTSINICANLNICASKSPTSPSLKTLQINATLHKIDKSKHTYMNCQPFKVFLCIKYNV